MQLETTTKVPVERLRLDRRNPRLSGQDEDASENAIIARLYRAAELDELLHQSPPTDTWTSSRWW